MIEKKRVLECSNVRGSEMLDVSDLSDVTPPSEIRLPGFLP